MGNNGLYFKLYYIYTNNFEFKLFWPKYSNIKILLPMYNYTCKYMYCYFTNNADDTLNYCGTKDCSTTAEVWNHHHFLA